MTEPVDRSLDADPAHTIEFETGESFLIPEMTVREALHHLNTPDITEELSEKLEKFKEAHDRYIRDNVEPNIEVLAGGETVYPPYDTPLNELEDQETIEIQVKQK